MPGSAMELDWESVRAELREYGQEHLLRHLEQLSESEKASLYADIKDVDFKKLSLLWKDARGNLTDNGEVKDDRLKPLDRSIVGSTAKDKEAVSRWSDIGLKKISQGQVAVLLLAGGQGTRLGVSYPKGMYNVGLPSGKTLYQLQAERILRLQNIVLEKYGVSAVIPWYIMTSDYTKQPTLQFFEENKYFGLEPENVILFEQFTLPCLDFEGRVLLSKPGAIARAPDGNGGLYTALASPRNSVLGDMERRGIACVHIYCVDNILVKMADPVFVGFCQEKGAECGAKVVQKVLPTEKVGVVCSCDGLYQVVEYSEISIKIAEMRDEDGSLTFKAGNICNHFVTMDFLNRVCTRHENELTHHVAKKKITHVTDGGDLVTPTQPNGLKLEKFVFDVFQFASKFAVLEVLREDEFSPMKNAPGAGKNTPTTARMALMDLHYRQLLAAGGALVNKDNKKLPLMMRRESDLMDEAELVCEISPLVSYFGEGLEELCKGERYHPPVHITNGKSQ